MRIETPGATKFTQLSDVPNSYAGDAGLVATVNPSETGIIWTSKSGGGGFATLSSTEIPNGIITVFTFAGASGVQPSYLVVDNVWEKAINKDSSVNWTWNAGLNQATLSVPPTNDIWGVV